ncbi:MAG: hypothetical protein ACYSTT_05560, partial [Planctomycetota bacterium]
MIGTNQINIIADLQLLNVDCKLKNKSYYISYLSRKGWHMPLISVFCILYSAFCLPGCAKPEPQVSV